MQHSHKFGVAALIAAFGGGFIVLGAAETPAFAQATAARQVTGAPVGGTVTARGSTTVTPEMEARRRALRVTSWPTDARQLRTVGDARVGQRGSGRRLIQPGKTVVQLTAAECVSLGGEVWTPPDGGSRMCGVVTTSGTHWTTIDE